MRKNNDVVQFLSDWMNFSFGWIIFPRHAMPVGWTWAFTPITLYTSEMRDVSGFYIALCLSKILNILQARWRFRIWSYFGHDICRRWTLISSSLTPLSPVSLACEQAPSEGGKNSACETWIRERSEWESERESASEASGTHHQTALGSSHSS